MQDHYFHRLRGIRDIWVPGNEDDAPELHSHGAQCCPRRIHRYHVQPGRVSLDVPELRLDRLIRSLPSKVQASLSLFLSFLFFSFSQPNDGFSPEPSKRCSLMTSTRFTSIARCLLQFCLSFRCSPRTGLPNSLLCKEFISRISVSDLGSHLLFSRSGGSMEDATMLAQLTGIMAMSGVMSFMISYSTIWCIRVTSSTTFSMIGALNKLPMAIIGMLFFKNPTSAGNILSILVGE